MTRHSVLDQKAVTITTFAWNGSLGRQFKVSVPLPFTEIWYYSGAGSVLPSKCGLFDQTGTIVPGTLKTSPTWSGLAGSGWVKTVYDGSVIIPANVSYEVSCYVNGSVISYVAGTNPVLTNGCIYGSLSYFDSAPTPTPDLIYVTGTNANDFLVDVGVDTPTSLSVSDNFNRADGGLGSDWTVSADTGTDQTTLAISTNAVNGGAGLTATSFWSASAVPDYQYSEVVVSALPASMDWIGPVVRESGDGTKQYLVIAWNNAGTYTLELFKRSGGTYTALATIPWASATAGDVIRLEAYGSNLTVFQNGVEVIFAKDTDYVWGQPGITSFGATAKVDNWSSAGVSDVPVITLTNTTGNVKTYSVETPINRSMSATPSVPTPPQPMRILTPTNPSQFYAHAFLWILPVEPGQGTTYGDPIAHIQALNLQDNFNLTCIQPGFPIDPWYANNDTDLGVQQETFMLRLYDWVKAHYAISGREDHYLIGFSKSGLGAQRMFWRNQDIYSAVASWDFPGNETYSEFGGDSAAVYGTQANWDANYDVNSHLSAWKANGDTLTVDRVWTGDTVTFDDSGFDLTLTGLGILHQYVHNTHTVHNWVSSPDWMDVAITFLAGVGPPPVVAGCLGAAGIV